MHVDHPGGPLECLRLVFLQPQQLVEAGGRVRRLAGDPMHLLRPEPLDLLSRARVEPHDRGPYRAVLGVHAHERLSLVRDADGADPAGVYRPSGPAQRDDRRAPPLVGVLLAPVGPRDAQGQRLAPLGDGVPLTIPDHGFRGGGRAIYPDNVVRRAHLSRALLPWARAKPRNVLCTPCARSSPQNTSRVTPSCLPNFPPHYSNSEWPAPRMHPPCLRAHRALWIMLP